MIQGLVEKRGPVQRLRIARLGHDAVRLDEASPGRIILPRLVEVQPDGVLPALPGVAVGQVDQSRTPTGTLQ